MVAITGASNIITRHMRLHLHRLTTAHQLEGLGVPLNTMGSTDITATTAIMGTATTVTTAIMTITAADGNKYL